MQHFRERRDARSRPDGFHFVNRVVKHLGNKNLIHDYYSQSRIDSREAKTGWMKPDIKPLLKNRDRAKRGEINSGRARR